MTTAQNEGKWLLALFNKGLERANGKHKYTVYSKGLETAKE